MSTRKLLRYGGIAAGAIVASSLASAGPQTEPTQE
jgi:hypothetical protein